MTRLFQYLTLTAILLNIFVDISRAIDVSAYQDFLVQNENLTADSLLAQYPAGQFTADTGPIDREIPTDFTDMRKMRSVK